MTFKKALILVFISPLLAFTSAHKYYVSLTQVDYNQKSQALQMTMTVFIDDMETALNNTFNKQFNLYTEKEPEDSSQFFENYLKKHFMVKLEDKSREISFIGRKYEGDVVYLYFEIEHVTEVETIEIQNDMLMEFFAEQKNMIKLNINGEFDSLMLTKNNAKGVLNF